MRRTASTAAVVAILAVGFWLGNMFKGFGLGPGGGGGNDSSSQSPGPGAEGPRDPNKNREAIDSQKEIASTPETLPEAQPAPSPSPEGGSPGAPNMVTVAIDGAGYALSTDGVRFQPATLGQVTEVARETKGNDQGVRVRVVRKKNAVNGARLDLFHDLEAAGLKREAIQEMTGFVD